MKLLAATLGICCALAARADAMCVVPMWTGTPPSDIPLHGSLYVFDAALEQVRYELRLPDDATVVEELRKRGEHLQDVSWIGIPGASEQVVISPSVVRIDYEGTAGSSLIVNNTTYTLVPYWHGPLEAPTVMSYTRRMHAQTCSVHDALHFKLDQPTAAIRARWEHRGSTHEWTVPARDLEDTPTLVLGDINCAGRTLDTRQLDDGGHLELFAIRIDGTEVPISGLPARLTASTIPTHGSLDREPPPEVELELEPPPIDIGDPPVEDARTWPIVVALAGLALAMIALTRVRTAA